MRSRDRGSAARETARERIHRLVDERSFKEVGTLATYKRHDVEGNPAIVTPSSFICGLARVNGRNVVVGAEDFTVSGGTTTEYLDRAKGEVGGFADDLAHGYKIPMLSLLEGVGGGGQSEQSLARGTLPGGMENVVPGAAYLRPLELLDMVPCLTAILGPAAGYAAGRAVMAHFTVMTRDTACVFIGGPPMVKDGLGIDIDKFALGGAHIQSANGTVDNVAEDEADAIDQLTTVLGFLPQNVWALPPVAPCDDPIERRNDALLSIFPENPRRAYDPRKIVREVFDPGSFFEIGAGWGRSIVQGLARIGGRPVGVVASNPAHLGGALDVAACEKQSRFIEFCDTFHLPLVIFIDNPGFMVGEKAERAGIVRSAMRAMTAILWANVPVVSVYLRKAVGLGPMSQANPANVGLKLAWPTVEPLGMAAGGEFDAKFARQLGSAANPEELRKQAAEATARRNSPWLIAEHFGIEEIIHPAETREYVGRFIDAAWDGMVTTLGPPNRRPRV
jgi:acetyl-CoA carboxylase carboxyltransferase component